MITIWMCEDHFSMILRRSGVRPLRGHLQVRFEADLRRRACSACASLLVPVSLSAFGSDRDVGTCSGSGSRGVAWSHSSTHSGWFACTHRRCAWLLNLGTFSLHLLHAMAITLIGIDRKIRRHRLAVILRRDVNLLLPPILVVAIERLRVLAVLHSDVFDILLLGRIAHAKMRLLVGLIEVERAVRFCNLVSRHSLVHVHRDVHDFGKLRNTRIHEDRRTITRAHARRVWDTGSRVNLEVGKRRADHRIVKQLLPGRLLRQRRRWRRRSGRSTVRCLQNLCIRKLHRSLLMNLIKRFELRNVRIDVRHAPVGITKLRTPDRCSGIENFLRLLTIKIEILQLLRRR